MKLLLLVAAIAFVSAAPNGAAQCSVSDNPAVHPKALSNVVQGKAGFQFTTNNPNLVSNGEYTFTLNDPTGNNFKGFLLYVEDGVGNKVGEFKESDNHHFATLPVACRTAATATHKDATERAQLVIQWTAPALTAIEVEQGLNVRFLVYSAEGFFRQGSYKFTKGAVAPAAPAACNTFLQKAGCDANAGRCAWCDNNSCRAAGMCPAAATPCLVAPVANALVYTYTYGDADAIAYQYGGAGEAAEQAADAADVVNGISYSYECLKYDEDGIYSASSGQAAVPGANANANANAVAYSYDGQVYGADAVMADVAAEEAADTGINYSYSY